MDDNVLKERERAATIADDLANLWEKSAERHRLANQTRFFGLGKPYTLPQAEKEARIIDSAVKGLRTVAYLIRDGALKNEDSK